VVRSASSSSSPSGRDCKKVERRKYTKKEKIRGKEDKKKRKKKEGRKEGRKEER
jgi:hypothetical protein